MSNEEMNKKMEFIIEQQAQFAADIEVMREIHAADAKLFKENDRILSDAITTVVGLVGNLAQAQIRTEERLNIFINVVERHIGGNGGAEKRA
jgi:GTP-sensing pleiotropic transcriptional regulator CodY